MNILFVCTGNTCRSPMAAAIMNELVIKNSLNVRVASAGISAFERDGATGEAVAAMSEYGIDLTGHRAKRINDALLKESDLIITMTQAHKLMLCKMAEGRVFTAAEYAGDDGDVSDPYGRGLDAYKQTAEQLYHILSKISDRLLTGDGND